MKTIRCYLDFAAPEAWLAFHALPQSLLGTSYIVEYCPVSQKALRPANPAPNSATEHTDFAEIQRRSTEWAQQNDVELGFPVDYPFDSLLLLRLAIACSTNGCINRYTADTIFRHVWASQSAPVFDENRLAELQQALQYQLKSSFPINSPANEERLNNNIQEAIAQGIANVPSFAMDDQIFRGLDALPALRTHID